MNLNKFAAEVHQNAVEHGWWEEERTYGEIISLCHSELSEALEEFRAGRPTLHYKCDSHDTRIHCPEKYDGCQHGANTGCMRRKPEGIAVELADCIIRILDYLGMAGADVDALMAEAEEFDDLGAATNFGDLLADCHLWLSLAYLSERQDIKARSYLRMAACIVQITTWAKKNGVDMEKVLDLKHAYNKDRPYRHGGKAL